MLWQAVQADLAARLGEEAAGRLLPYLQRRLLDEGGLLLLDGLDEVPEANRRRKCLLEAVADLAASLPPERCRVVVTARPYAYADPKWHLPGFRSLILAPFDEGQVSRFLTRWYGAVGPVMGWDERDGAGSGATPGAGPGGTRLPGRPGEPAPAVDADGHPAHQLGPVAGGPGRPVRGDGQAAAQPLAAGAGGEAIRRRHRDASRASPGCWL